MFTGEGCERVRGKKEGVWVGGQGKQSRMEGRERRKRRGRKGDRRLLCSAKPRAAGRKQVSLSSTFVVKEKQQGRPRKTFNH